MNVLTSRDYEQWKSKATKKMIIDCQKDGSIILLLETPTESHYFHLLRMTCNYDCDVMSETFKLYEIREHIYHCGSGNYSWLKKMMLDILHFDELPAHQIIAYIDEFNDIFM